VPGRYGMMARGYGFSNAGKLNAGEPNAATGLHRLDAGLGVRSDVSDALLRFVA
jgi:hypothetical protein